MIDNLKDAIEHAKEVAESKRKTIKEVYEKLEEDRPLFEEQENACLECAKEHEQLAAWLTELQERREADRWIPVSERLPDKDGQYEVTREEYIPSDPDYHTFDIEGAPHWKMVVDLAKFEGNYNRANGLENYNNGFNKAYRVHAWRPLPKPYESEAENE